MLFEEDLKQIAMGEAARLQSEQLAIDQENLQLNKRKLELKLKSRKISLALQHATEFVPLLGGKHYCPFCWIRIGRQSILRARGSPDDRDIFGCRDCGHEFITPNE